MQASTSQVESYAGFNISHPVPDFKAVRSLNIPNYEFLNKPRPLQRCESLRRIVQLWMSYEWPSSLIVRIPYFRFGTILIAEKCWKHLKKIILHVESNFRGHFRFENIPKTIFNHFVNWVHECTARLLLVDLMKPLKGLCCGAECTTAQCGASQTLRNIQLREIVRAADAG